MACECTETRKEDHRLLEGKQTTGEVQAAAAWVVTYSPVFRLSVSSMHLNCMLDWEATGTPGEVMASKLMLAELTSTMPELPPASTWGLCCERLLPLDHMASAWSC